MKQIRLRGMAKINLGLDVVRRLENGYHELKMVMQTIDLYDTLELCKTESGIKITTDKDQLPCDEHNLIYKAYAALTAVHPLAEGVSIHLTKRIPMAAGMAGGSTDAAMTLVGLNKLFGLGLTLEELAAIGVKVGADVPYCIYGGTRLAEGIGEVLTVLPAPPEASVVIAKPAIEVSTKYVYENLHANSLSSHPDMEGVLQGIRGGDLGLMCNSMENVLETVTEREYPVIAQIKALLRSKGALCALMSGSGPTVFGIFKKEEDAREALEALAETNLAPERCLTGWAPETCIVEEERD